MKVIIKKESVLCEHEKPYPTAVLRGFQTWQERTCSMKEFDKKFGKQEGLWKSKGKNHKEITCYNEGCYCTERIHCRRQMENKKFWSIIFKDISEFERFIKENGYMKIFLEEEDGRGITLMI